MEDAKQLPERVVLNAARPKTFGTAQALKGMGVVLLVVTALLIWKEVSMEAVVMLLVGSAAAFAGAVVLERNGRPMVGPVLALTTVLVSALWYAVTREALVLAPLTVGFGLFGWLSWRHHDRTARAATRGHRVAVFQGLAWSSVALTLAASFQLFHASELLNDGFLARRVVVTVLWLAGGLLLLVFGGKREDAAMQGAGAVLTVAAIGKLLVYDTLHLEGVLRIVAFALAGGLMMLGGTLLARKSGAVQS